MVALLREEIPVQESGPLESALTDGEGIARFSSAPAGLFNICARGARHKEFCEEGVGLVAGGTVSSVLALPPGASIRGQVLLPDGSPAAGIRLTAWGDSFDPGHLMPTQAVTDVMGNYHLDGVTSGWADILVDAPVAFPFLDEGRYSPRTVEVVGEMDVSLDIQLGALVPVSVRPHLRHTRGAEFNPDIASVSMATRWGRSLLVRQEDGSWTGRVESGLHHMALVASSGETNIVVERAVDVRTDKPVVIPVTHVTSVETRRVGPRQSAPVLHEPDTFEFAGHVLLPDGTPARGFRISVRPSYSGPTSCGNGPFVYRHVRFEGSAFAVRLPVVQTFAFVWTDNGFAGFSSSSRKKAGEPVVKDIQLESAGAIQGRVDLFPDFARSRAPDFRFENQSIYELKHVTQDGRFVIAGIPPGRHSMEIEGNAATYRFDVQGGVATDLGDLRRGPQ